MCIVHCVVNCLVHCIVRCIVHSTVPCTIHYAVHYTVHSTVQAAALAVMPVARFESAAREKLEAARGGGEEVGTGYSRLELSPTYVINI